MSKIVLLATTGLFGLCALSVGAASLSTTPSGSSNSALAGVGNLKYTGVNIAGFDFGCGTDGTCVVSGVAPPLTQFGGADGAGQMQHFVRDDGFNVFRLPVGWQFLTNNVLGGTLDPTNFAKYDALVQACLSTGASCLIDIHNYARWDGQIIGQGGPTNEQFAALWSSLATKYANEPMIIFGVMNEPHDIPDITIWAATVQVVVNAIRNAGANSQMILLPGNDWTSAATFISNGSADALKKVTNPDGTTNNLVFDVHKYSDSDNSGTHAECVTDNISTAFAPLALWLRSNGRQALNTEMGGGNTASCVQYVCAEVAFQKANSDVILGHIGWAAGSFATSYVLSSTPTFDGSVWTDQLLLKSCEVPN